MTDLRAAIDVSAVPRKPAGAGRYVIELVKALRTCGSAQLHLIARSDDAARWEALGGIENVHAVAPVRRPLRLVWEQVQLPRLLKHMDVDLYHGPHYTMPERARIPRVVTVHDLTFFTNPEWHERLKGPFFRRATRVAARHAEGIVCVSDATALLLREYCPTRAVLKVIPHGIDHTSYKPVEEASASGDATVLEELGVRQPYVLFVGTLEPRKNIPTLIQAFDRISTSHPGLTLVLAGGRGWGTDAVEAEIARTRSRESIIRLGYVEEKAVPVLLRRSSVVAYPSFAEGFGLPAAEALACGAPLVTSKGTAMEEIAADAALAVDPSDVVALADALDQLVRGDPGQEERRRRGLAATARLTWQNSAGAHLDFYREVARSGSLGSST